MAMPGLIKSLGTVTAAASTVVVAMSASGASASVDSGSDCFDRARLGVVQQWARTETSLPQTHRKLAVQKVVVDVGSRPAANDAEYGWIKVSGSGVTSSSFSDDGRPLVTYWHAQEYIAAELELRAIARLKPGWDGEGAAAPSPEAISRARLLIGQLVGSGELGFSVHADGRVIVERHSDLGYDEILVPASGPISVYSSRDHGAVSASVQDVRELMSTLAKA